MSFMLQATLHSLSTRWNLLWIIFALDKSKTTLCMKNAILFRHIQLLPAQTGLNSAKITKEQIKHIQLVNYDMSYSI